MASNYNTEGFQQNLKYNEDNLIIVQKFFEERGYRCTKPNSMGAKTGGVSLNLTNPASPRDFIPVSVKADSWIGRTGNLVIELQHVRKNAYGQQMKENGWFKDLRAQKLVVIDTTEQYIYLFDWTRLKAFISANLENPSVCKVQEQENRFDKKCMTTNAFIKIELLEKEGLVDAKRKYQFAEEA